MNVLKYIFYFILFFGLFYVEVIELPSGITISQLWKMPFFFFMAVYIILYRAKKIPTFVKLKGWIAFKQLIITDIFNTSFLSNIMQLTKNAMFPIMFYFFNLAFHDSRKLEKLTLTISQYFILTCIPFMLGWIPSIEDGLMYGDYVGFTGIFGAQHAAASVVTISIIVILRHLEECKSHVWSKLYNFGLCIIGCYAVYATLARTGWVMLALGVIILYLPSHINTKQFVRMLCSICLIIFAYTYLYNNSELFRAKVEDRDVETGYQYEKGSGRLIFAQVSLSLWEEGNLGDKLFGVGLDQLQDNMYDKIGHRIFSHNGFIDALVANGLIGLFLMVLFIFYMLYFVFKCKHTPYFRLGLILSIQYIAFQATQGGGLFQIDLFMALIFVAMLKQKSLILHNEHINN